MEGSQAGSISEPSFPALLPFLVLDRLPTLNHHPRPPQRTSLSTPSSTSLLFRKIYQSEAHQQRNNNPQPAQPSNLSLTMSSSTTASISSKPASSSEKKPKVPLGTHLLAGGIAGEQILNPLFPSLSRADLPLSLPRLSRDGCQEWLRLVSLPLLPFFL